MKRFFNTLVSTIVLLLLVSLPTSVVKASPLLQDLASNPAVEEYIRTEILASGDVDLKKAFTYTDERVVSSDFIASDYCYKIEFSAAAQRARDAQLAIVPVILRPCLWRRTPLNDFAALPRDADRVERVEADPVLDHEVLGPARDRLPEGFRAFAIGVLEDRAAGLQAANRRSEGGTGALVVVRTAPGQRSVGAADAGLAVDRLVSRGVEGRPLAGGWTDVRDRGGALRGRTGQAVDAYRADATANQRSGATAGREEGERWAGVPVAGP